ncbi:Di19 domain-containing protein [Cephalotus follicularis]|uniref:Di19 domain-containing protein n=1 Tax=Cephalotus follicularis TaxID=3775 RepID=A0A1Q3BF08_CEPFO|nr:Di19 domain-containing protein [Cephalotus follicularis]
MTTYVRFIKWHRKITIIFFRRNSAERERERERERESLTPLEAPTYKLIIISFKYLFIIIGFLFFPSEFLFELILSFEKRYFLKVYTFKYLIITIVTMDANSWSARLSVASRRFQSALQSRSEMFIGFEEIDGDDDIREEFPCPFCSEYFDIVGLCCHIDDEHPLEAKNGVCPVCAMRVGVDMVAHITSQHGNIFNMQRKRKSRKGGPYSTLSLLRKELREGNLQSLFGGSSCIVSSSNAAPDPLLSSFILPMADGFASVPHHFSTETSSAKKSSVDTVSERNVKSSPLSIKDQEEKRKRSEFVQGLLLSTILDDNL